MPIPRQELTRTTRTPSRQVRAQSRLLGAGRGRPVRAALLAAALAGTVLAAPLATLAAAQAQAGPGTARAAPFDRGYTAPLHAPVEVARGFDAPEERWLSGHRGVDLRAVPGEPVLAPAAGVVTFAGPVAGRVVLTLRHPDGRRSSLEPVVPGVATGDVVEQGAPVGQVGGEATHCAPATCLHWGVRTADDVYVDPLTLLAGRGPVVLLPDAP